MAASIALPLDVRRVILKVEGAPSRRSISATRFMLYFQIATAANAKTPPPITITATAMSATRVLFRLMPVAMYSALEGGCDGADVVAVGGIIPDRVEVGPAKISVATSPVRDAGGKERSIPAEMSSSRLSSFRSTS